MVKKLLRKDSLKGIILMVLGGNFVFIMMENMGFKLVFGSMVKTMDMD